MNTLRMTEREKLAMVVGAAGRHNMLFLGSPVCGRSLLLEKLRELFPPLTEEEAESVNRIASLETDRRFIDDKTLEKAVTLLDNTPAMML